MNTGKIVVHLQEPILVGYRAKSRFHKPSIQANPNITLSSSKIGQRPYSTRSSGTALSTNFLTTLCLVESRWCSRIVDVELRSLGCFIGIELSSKSLARYDLS